MTRYALRNFSSTTDPERELATVQRYMPSNYSAKLVYTDRGAAVLIFGEDVAGWGLDTYVLPRLASGWFTAREIMPETVALLADSPVPAQ